LNIFRRVNSLRIQTISDIEKTKEKHPDFHEKKEAGTSSSLEELEDQYAED